MKTSHTTDDGAVLKIAILGGTFNPPHVGHLRLAEEVASAHGLDRVIFIPCYIPPHKDSVDVAAPGHRLAMTRLACDGNPLFEVSDLELSFEGPSYTVTTLEYFAQQPVRETYFVMGSDSMKEIHTWKDYERLFSLSHFIVVTRPGTEFREAWSHVPTWVRAQFEDRGSHLLFGSTTKLIPSPVVGLDISSTTIRALLRNGKSIRYLVTDSVRTYIEQQKLYGYHTP